MSNTDIFGLPVANPLDLAALTAQLDNVEAGDYSAEIGGFEKIQFNITPVGGAQQSSRNRMVDAAITGELSRLQSLAGWLGIAGTAPDGDEGVPYAFTPTTTGGTGNKTFAVTSGALPTGTTLDPTTGAVSGTPSVAGPYAFDITATDEDYNTAVLSNTVTISGAGP